MTKAVYRESVICDHIPADISRNVGRLIIKWAAFEYRLQAAIWKLSGVDEVTGRLAIREPRAEERIALIKDLIQVRGGKINDNLFKNAVKTTKAIQEKRNLLAHSPWTKGNGEYRIIKTSGNLPDQTLVNKKRQIRPEGMLVTAANLVRIIHEIDKLSQFANECSSTADTLIIPPEASS